MDKKKILKYSQFIVTLIISVILLFSLILEAFSTLFLSIICLFILFFVAISSIEFTIYSIFLLAPFFTYLMVFGTQLFNFIIVVFLGKYFLFNLKKIKLGIFILPLILVFFEFVHIGFGGTANLKELIKWLLTSFVFSILIYEFPIYKKYAKNIIYYYILGIFIISLSCIFSNWDNIINTSGRDFLVGMAKLEKNTYAIYCNVGLMAILFMLKLNLKKNFILIIPFITIFVSTIFMMSKSFLLVFLICFLIYVIVSIRSVESFFASVCIVVLLILLVSSSEYLMNVIRLYLKRFDTYENIDNFTTGRLEIFKEYIDYLLTHPISFFFGEGLYSYMYNVKETFIIKYRPHNLELELLISWGLIGTLIISFISLKMYKKSMTKYKKNISIYSILPMLALFLGLQSITLIYQIPTFFMIIFCLYVMYSKIEGNELYVK